MYTVIRAERGDLPEILQLQYLAYQSEAELFGSRDIPPLKQTLDEVAEEFADAVRRSRDRDLYLKSTEVGPHRDDLRFTVNGIDIRHYGSQGQQRSAALSLKLAEIELVREASDDVPVLLLDDVLSELDTNRQHALLDSIGSIQTFITCTGLEEYENSPVQIDRIFHVTAGSVSPG